MYMSTNVYTTLLTLIMVKVIFFSLFCEVKQYNEQYLYAKHMYYKLL